MGAAAFFRAIGGLALVLVTACGTPSEPSVLTGVWGGEHVLLTIADASAHLEFDCAHGDIPTRVPAAPFSVAGTFVREHGGPIRVDEMLDSRPALYVATISGGVMTLTIRLTDTGEIVGTFTLTRGATGRAALHGVAMQHADADVVLADVDDFELLVGLRHLEYREDVGVGDICRALRDGLRQRRPLRDDDQQATYDQGESSVQHGVIVRPGRQSGSARLKPDPTY